VQFEFEENSGIEDEGLKAIALGCPALEKLMVCACQNITDSSIALLAQNCPKLHFLDMFGLKKITDEAIVAIAQGCPLLEFIDIAWCDITDRSFVALVDGCPLLTELGEFDHDVLGNSISQDMFDWFAVWLRRDEAQFPTIGDFAAQQPVPR